MDMPFYYRLRLRIVAHEYEMYPEHKTLFVSVLLRKVGCAI